MLDSDDMRELSLKANAIRHHIIEMVYAAGSGHPGGSLSATDIIVALYFKLMNYDPENPKWEDRDRFVLSKGHAAPALYATLAELGLFPVEELLTLRKVGSRLQGHPDMRKLPGIEASTGSLGQGLSIANGMALSAKLDRKLYHVFAMLGDGEVEEGQVWEAAMFASHYKLDNLIAFLDRNRLQIDGETEQVMSIEPIMDKWKAFGWEVREINGHDFKEIADAVEWAKDVKGKPAMIIAHTVKGKGVSFMEGSVHFHGKPPNDEEYRIALQDLDAERERILGGDS